MADSRDVGVMVMVGGETIMFSDLALRTRTLQAPAAYYSLVSCLWDSKANCQVICE